MKKYFYKIVFAVSIVGIMGFGECSELWYGLWGIPLKSISAGFFSHGLNPDGSGEIYNIAVGKSGKIYTGEGRSPGFWNESQSGITENLNLVKVYNIPDSLIAFTIGDGGTVLLSRDKGFTWEDRSIPGFTGNLYGLDYFYVPQGVGIVVCGDSGIICISTDSGINWAQHNTLTTNKLNSVMAYGGDNVVAVGDNGTIIKGGPQFGWEDVSVDPNINLYKIFPGIGLSYSKLWAVGSNGKIYYSTDYGYDWGTQNSGVTTDLYDIIFRNSLEGVAVGANGTVRYTSNAGITWNEDTYLSGLTTRGIISISGVDSNTASCITVNNFNGDSQGADTTFFLSVSSEPFVGVDEEKINPTEFKLEQNYPNPFNPSTTIKYSIPLLGLVTVRVYDILGKEVATLVNEEKNAGSYEISFNPSDLASGVYFYKLMTVNYSNTKKLVLIK